MYEATPHSIASCPRHPDREAHRPPCTVAGPHRAAHRQPERSVARAHVVQTGDRSDRRDTPRRYRGDHDGARSRRLRLRSLSRNVAVHREGPQASRGSRSRHCRGNPDRDNDRLRGTFDIQLNRGCSASSCMILSNLPPSARCRAYPNRRLSRKGHGQPASQPSTNTLAHRKHPDDVLLCPSGHDLCVVKPSGDADCGSFTTL